MRHRPTPLPLIACLLATSACGWDWEKELLGRDGEQAPAQGPARGAEAEMDPTRPLAGQILGVNFVPRSIVFASGRNQDGLEETHIVASSARNYCEHIRDGIDQHHSMRVMLRVVRYVGDLRADHAGPGEYTQQQEVEVQDDTLGVPPPAQVPVRGGTGAALTAAVAHVRAGCNGQRLFAAAPESSLTIDAHDFTGLRGHLSLKFDRPRGISVDPNMLLDPNALLPNHPRAAAANVDGLDESQPIRVGGTFIATPCPWLGSVLSREAQAPFRAYQCLP